MHKDCREQSMPSIQSINYPILPSLREGDTGIRQNDVSSSILVMLPKYNSYNSCQIKSESIQINCHAGHANT